MSPVLTVALLAFFASFIVVPFLLGVLQFFGAYAIVEERVCHVYVLFGKVILILDEPGVSILWARMGWRAPIVRWLGTRYVLDMSLDQTYLRSQPVNSEEGAPMGIGIWYEMFVSDPVSYLFKNNDPRGSLRANVSNATVRSLSNMKLATLLENRHAMSRAVREEATTILAAARADADSSRAETRDLLAHARAEVAVLAQRRDDITEQLGHLSGVIEALAVSEHSAAVAGLSATAPEGFDAMPENPTPHLSLTTEATTGIR